MQIATYILLALAATTTALPGAVPEFTTTDVADYEATPTDAALFNQSLPELEKRGHYGWIASFATKDHGCKGGYAEPRPKIHSKCITFHPVQSRVKVCCSPFSFPSFFPVECWSGFIICES